MSTRTIHLPVGVTLPSLVKRKAPVGEPSESGAEVDALERRLLCVAYHNQHSDDQVVPLAGANTRGGIYGIVVHIPVCGLMTAERPGRWRISYP
jgi:hypothetical protein